MDVLKKKAIKDILDMQVNIKNIHKAEEEHKYIFI
jgi:hypothetical protein